MKRKKLGSSELELSVIGLGTWAMGGTGWEYSWGPQDDRNSIATIHRALDMGINWIDTAPVYGMGHSETIVGKAIKGMKDKPIIATKCSRLWDEQGKVYSNLKKESIYREAEDSLRRLQTDVIDLYQMHRAWPEEDIEEGWTAMTDLVKQGKVRYIGVSNFTAEQIQLVEKIHPVVSVQPSYSMLSRKAETSLFPYCKSKNIGIVCYSPMSKGLLTGKVSKSWVDSLPADDHRKNDRQFQSPLLEINLELIENLKPIAERHGVTLGQLAIAWVIHREEVTSAIVGSRAPDQIASAVPAADVVLNKEDLEEIRRLLKIREERLESI